MDKLIFSLLLLIVNVGNAAYLDSVEVSNFPAIQPVSQSGVWTIDSITDPLTITGTVNVLGPLTDAQLRASAVPVSLASVPTHPVTQSGAWTVGVNNFPAVQDVNVTNATLDIGNFPATQPISAVSLPLPAGASTSALQTTGNTALNNIDAKTPALGQTTMANSVPVTIASNQSPLVLTATNLDIRDLSFTNDFVDVSGSTVGISNFPLVQPVDDNGGSLTVDGTVGISGTVSVTGGLTDAQLRASAVPVSLASTTITNFPATQPVSAASLPLPAGAATAANQATEISSLASIDLGTPAALGQTTMSASMPVTIASNQTALPVTGTFFQATQPVSGTVTANAGTGTFQTNITNASLAVTGPLTDTQLRATPVPVFGIVTANLGTISGVATETTLSALNTKIPASPSTDRTTAAAPFATRLTDGTAFYKATTPTDTQPISAASLPLPTGAATSANQSTMITALNSIVTNTGTANTDTLQTGTITALNGTVTINAQGAFTVSGIVTGTFVGTVVAEGLMADGTTWQQLPTLDIINFPYATTFNYSAPARFLITGGGYTSIRVRSSAFTSGTINVSLNASLGQQTIFAQQAGAWNVVNTPVPNNLGVTAVGAANAAVTATLPAVAGLFHYIDSIEVTLYSTAARTGVAAPIVCTTTNFSAAHAYIFPTAGVIGSEVTKQFNNANRPIKSAVANTATTIVCPAVTGGLWRMNIVYSTGL